MICPRGWPAVVACWERRIVFRRRRCRMRALLQHTSALHEQAQVNRLVRHLHVRILWMGPLEPARDLLRRPIRRELLGHARAQDGTLGESTALGRSARSHVAASATAARYPRRPPCRPTSRLTVDVGRPSCTASWLKDTPVARPREISSRSLTVRARDDRQRGGGGMPAASPHHVEDRRRNAVDGPADLTQRFSARPSIPNRCLVACTHPRSSHALHDPSDHSSRCIDALNPPYFQQLPRF